MPDTTKKISVVIPVHNSGKTLPLLYEQIALQFGKEPSYSFEVIFVNDGSSDDTQALIEGLKGQDKRVKYIAFTRNFGQVAAIEAGLKYAEGDAVIVMSADMQEPFSLSARMLEKWESGSKVVIACRQTRSDGKLDKWLSGIFYNLIQWSNPMMPKGGFDYCLFDRTVNEHMRSIGYRNRFLQGDLLYLGFDTTFVTYERVASAVPSAPLKNLPFKLKYFIDGVLNTTALPVRIITVLGILCTAFGFLYSFIIFINWLLGNTPFKGWAPIMIAIMIIGGLIMLMLGVLGEYIWRIYDELKQMPKYVIKDKDTD